MEYDILLKRIGEFGRYQKTMYILLGLVGVPCAMYNLGYMFWAARLDHWCEVPNLDNLTNLTQVEKQKLSIPWIKSSGGKLQRSQCYMYDHNYTALTIQDARQLLHQNMSQVPLKKCSSWLYDHSQYKSSIVSQWNLVCDYKWLISTSQSVYMAGKIVGAFTFGYLADRFGRRLVLVSTIMGMVASSIIISFSPNYTFFIMMRFVWSTAATSVFQIAFVIGMELVGVSWRVPTGMMIMVFWALGYMLVSGLAYAIRDHFHLQLAISLPWLLLFTYYWIVPESPRWLIVNGYQKKAQDMIRRIAKFNKVKLADSDIEITVQTEKRTGANILGLLRTTQMRWKTLILFYTWFANSFVYYGLSLNSSNLGANSYLSNFLSGAVEIPAYVAALVSLMKIGRRIPQSTTMIVAGAALLLTLAIPPGNPVPMLIVSMIGKLAISSSYAMVYVYTAELLPTVVRSAGVGACNLVSRVAGVITVFCTDLEEYYQGLPLVLCGAIALSSGLLVLFLPETRNCPLPETLQDGEALGLLTPPFLRKKKDQMKVSSNDQEIGLNKEKVNCDETSEATTVNQELLSPDTENNTANVV